MTTTKDDELLEQEKLESFEEKKEEIEQKTIPSVRIPYSKNSKNPIYGNMNSFNQKWWFSQNNNNSSRQRVWRWASRWR